MSHTVAGGIIAFGVLTAICLALGIVKIYRMISCRTEVNAEITGFVRREGRLRKDSGLYMKLKYEYGGHTYEMVSEEELYRTGYQASDAPVGTVIPIKINPKNPRDFLVGGRRVLAAGAVLYLLMAAVFVICILIAILKQAV